MESFEKRFGLKGATITAVDLVRGLSKLIGFDLINVPGATGFIDTNYEGKGKAAIEAFEKYDIVFVHVEAPDEAAHSGNAQMKKKAIEQIDKYVVGPVLEALKTLDKWRILLMPDHPTFVKDGSHSSEPVPFAMAGDDIKGILQTGFCEANSAKGYELMEYFLKS